MRIRGMNILLHVSCIRMTEFIRGMVQFHPLQTSSYYQIITRYLLFLITAFLNFLLGLEQLFLFPLVMKIYKGLHVLFKGKHGLTGI